MKVVRALEMIIIASCLAMVGGCGQTADGAAIVNPTGSCGTRPDPGRVCYSGGGGTWIPDCQCPLSREYWRVYSLDGTTAFTLPRMDGYPAFQPACADDGDGLNGLVTRYQLCAPAMTAAAVNVVNSMAIPDAPS